jgi:tRNA A37 threonylcarbamoyladenosine dehydratase
MNTDLSTKRDAKTETPLQPMTDAELETDRLHRRFDRIGRLVGDPVMEKLFQTHVMIVGVGGVGSFAAESIARSGVGKITLVDFDEICVTNFNRQLHSLQGLVGEKKATVMEERLKKINPQSRIHSIPKFYNARFSDEIFEESKSVHGKLPDFVIDAIDSVTPKCHLLATCREKKLRVITSTGSGGKLDPTRIKVADLADTVMDPLAKALRKMLRAEFGFQDQDFFDIPAVYSDEPTREPIELHYDGGKGFRCVCPQGQNEFFSCDNRNVILGNASFVTGAFGLTCASVVVNEVINEVTKSAQANPCPQT